MVTWYFPVDRLLGRTIGASRLCFSLTALAVFGLSLSLTGCSGSGGAPEKQRSHLYRLGVAYNTYTRAHNQQPPADENTFREYISSLSEDQRKKLQAEDIDAFFTSPNSGERYTVLYGDQARKNTNGIIAYEQQPDADGRRLVASSLGDVSDVDEAEFNKLTSVSKKKN